MAAKVETNKGLLDRDKLTVIEQAHETNDCRVIHSIWQDKDTGEEVRRDVTVSVFRGLGLEEQLQGA